MLVIVKKQISNVLLVLAGDTEDSDHRAWLKQEAQRLGVAESILWTGWQPMQEGWRYVIAAEVGLSPFPRGYLLDMASPTKAVEYMALGLPVVANDNPDQQQVIVESRAGLCVPMSAQDFANATLTLLNDSKLRANMSVLGKAYVAEKRSYQQLAKALAAGYKTRI